MNPAEILSKMIKIESVNPPGNELEVARYLKQLFDETGVDNKIIESEKGRGNFLARLGEGQKRLLFLSHTDVVPPGEGWGFGPFSGEIKNGIVHGRGALDCKALVVAEAVAMLTLAKEQRLNGTLIFAATADEEKGGNFGIKYLLEKHKNEVMADFAVNEGAEEPLTINEQPVYFIQVGEKGTAWSWLRSKGISCHGSTPALGDNAVVKMAKAVAELDGYRPEVVLIPEVRMLLQEIARLKGQVEEVNEGNVDSIIEKVGDESLTAFFKAITRMTVSVNVIQGGVKTNIVPDSCTAEVDVRVLPGQNREYVIRELRKLIGEEIAIEIPDYHAPSFSSSGLDYYRIIESTIKEVVGEVTCLPHISAGATDSRFLRWAGIPSYGISLMAKDFDQTLRRTVHGPNERIDVASLQLKTEFLISLARKYLGYDLK